MVPITAIQHYREHILIYAGSCVQNYFNHFHRIFLSSWEIRCRTGPGYFQVAGVACARLTGLNFEECVKQQQRDNVLFS